MTKFRKVFNIITIVLVAVVAIAFTLSVILYRIPELYGSDFVAGLVLVTVDATVYVELPVLIANAFIDLIDTIVGKYHAKKNSK